MLLVFILHTYAVDGLHCCTKTTSKMSLSLHFTKGTILVYTLKRSTTIIDIVVCLVVCQGYFVELSGGFMTLVSWFWGYVFHGVPQCFFKWDTAIVWQCEDLSLNRLTSCASCWDHWIWRGSSDSPIDPCFCQSAPFLRLQPERARLQRTSRTRTLASTSLDVGGAWSDSRSRVYHKLVPLLTTQLTTWAPRKKKKTAHLTASGATGRWSAAELRWGYYFSVRFSPRNRISAFIERKRYQQRLWRRTGNREEF